jgi:MoaA/NifB/PqqE/SkfB family radical SAM enzyme
MGPTGERYRVLQIHPSRRCNLRCLHCYSSSGPDVRGELDAALLSRAIEDAAAEGYNVAGFSGGEPLLYRPLAELLGVAKRAGLRTTVTSNGMPLTERRLARLAPALDLLAISLDGVPASHNRMRAAERAFEIMEARLEGVRRSGIPFGFIFTLTQHNVHELDWVARFALDQGARLLQVHPLEIVGRAREELPESEPDAIEAAWAFVEVARIRQLAGDRMLVQLDLAPRDLLRDAPERVFAVDGPAAGPLADLLSPLVIEPDGTVVPIEFGFPRHFALGNLHVAPLRELGARWRAQRSDAFRAVCRDVFAEITDPAAPVLSNWYDAILRRAAASPASLSPA